VERLELALTRFAEVAEGATGRRVRDEPGSGAAGGLGAGLRLFTGARLVPGVDLVMRTLGLAERLQGVDLVLTGEGCTDAQTLAGKAPLGVARSAGSAGVPILCLSGTLGPGWEALLDQGFAVVTSLTTAGIPAEEALGRASESLRAATARLVTTWTRP
jgi:glycerate kinase